MAKIFRLQENVPDVYPRKSRDFQLLCNLFDIMQSGVKYDLDTITSVVDTRYCAERLLPLLQTKLGFFTQKQFNATELRTILTSFQDIIKDKGSIKGIREAIELYLKVVGASRKSRINITNKVHSSQISQLIMHGSSYNIEILVEGKVLDLTLLTELMKYVIPAGYRIKYSFYHTMDTIDYVAEQGTVNIIIVSSAVNNRVAAKDAAEVNNLLKYVFAKGIVDATTTYYSNEAKSYQEVSYSDILKSNAVEPVYDFTPVPQWTKYNGPSCEYDGQDINGDVVYGLVTPVKMLSLDDTEVSNSSKAYNIETQQLWQVVTVSIGSAYVPGMVYWEVLSSNVHRPPELDTDATRSIMLVKTAEASEIFKEETYSSSKVYTLGKSEHSKVNIYNLLSNRIITYRFTKQAEGLVFLSEPDVFGKSIVRSVKENEEFFVGAQYYTTDISFSDTSDTVVVGSKTYYILSTNAFYKQVTHSASIEILSCKWSIENNPLKTTSNEIYYEMTQTENYAFKEGQNDYFVLDTSDILLPNNVGTSTVVEVATTTIHEDEQGNDIFKTDSNSDGYVLKYLNGDIDDNE